MKKNLYLSILLFFIVLTTGKCKKEETGCIIPEIAPSPTYRYPVWRPDGQILGFNHKPLIKEIANGNAPCIYYTYQYQLDSAGFWLINADGSNLKKVLSFELVEPSWSPDGNWLAFSDAAGIIYKIKFNEESFDTTSIIRLTDSGKSFFPKWSSNGESIIFDSNMDTENGGYQIWKMRNDGTRKTLIGPGRFPFWFNNEILFSASDSEGPGIFKMDSSGQNKIKLVATSCGNPKAFGDNLFFEGGGLWSTNIRSGSIKKIFERSDGYDISTSGKIAFLNYDWSRLDSVLGTIWLMNYDGTDTKQLTFNYY